MRNRIGTFLMALIVLGGLQMTARSQDYCSQKSDCSQKSACCQKSCCSHKPTFYAPPILFAKRFCGITTSSCQKSCCSQKSDGCQKSDCSQKAACSQKTESCQKAAPSCQKAESSCQKSCDSSAKCGIRIRDRWCDVLGRMDVTLSNLLPCNKCKSSKCDGECKSCDAETKEVAKGDCGCEPKKLRFRSDRKQFEPTPMIDQPLFEENPFEDDTLQPPPLPVPEVEAQEAALPLVEPQNQTAEASEPTPSYVRPASFHFEPIVTVLPTR